MIDDENENDITVDEIMKASKRMKVEKAAEYDRVSSEMLRGCGDLEKPYDRVKGNDLWRTLSMHAVSSGLIQVLQYLYRGSITCVRINGEDNGLTSAGVSDRMGCQMGCVASPWLFNLFMNGCLHDLKEYKCGLKKDELFVKYLLNVEDQGILAP
ncbi:hypothetical protein EVAR_1028_1 [Eumeta japonica]|uniref:Reverse transcriptase domain-containing protein n=1 Tax=Eumeta variegata TaxID=151549 RepID=A0A4C1SF46_EUMVA|nr:hypothetical protein EVAR_1028_1 [Eumeta japonica]